MTWLISLLGQGDLPKVDPQVAGDALLLGMSTGEWLLTAAGAGLILIWILRLTLLTKLDGIALAITSVALIGVAATATALIANPTMWLEAIFAGVGAAVLAITSWDVLKKTKVGMVMDKAVEKRRGNP